VETAGVGNYCKEKERNRGKRENGLKKSIEEGKAAPGGGEELPENRELGLKNQGATGCHRRRGGSLCPGKRESHTIIS